MSAAITRILFHAQSRSRLFVDADFHALWNDDSSLDRTLCTGDWRDAIGVELHTLKASLEEIASECEEYELVGTASKLRRLAEDL